MLTLILPEQLLYRKFIKKSCIEIIDIEFVTITRMLLYKSFEEPFQINNAVVTAGTFDGVHVGHQNYIKAADPLCQGK